MQYAELVEEMSDVRFSVGCICSPISDRSSRHSLIFACGTIPTWPAWLRKCRSSLECSAFFIINTEIKNNYVLRLHISSRIKLIGLKISIKVEALLAPQNLRFRKMRVLHYKSTVDAYFRSSFDLSFCDHRFLRLPNLKHVGSAYQDYRKCEPQALLFHTAAF